MNLLRVLVTVSGMTMLSRIAGLVREIVQAALFGATDATDAFGVAFRIPNLLRRMFAEGAFSQAFVPILGEYKARRGPEETRTLVDDTATLLLWVLLGVTVTGVLCAPLLVWLLGSGLDGIALRRALPMSFMMCFRMVCRWDLSVTRPLMSTSTNANSFADMVAVHI